MVDFSSESSGPGSNATGGWGIQINGVNGLEFRRFLAGNNDAMMGGASMRSVVLPAGTHTIKAVHRRVSGTKAILTTAAVLVAWPVAPT